MDTFDYVVVGSGSGGSVVAGRLSEDPSVTVCLIEAGGPDKSVLIHVPVGAATMLPTRLNNWAFKTVPQAGLNGRRGYQPRGKTLGGSSSVNAMLYVRGNKWDYDHWAELGNTGWAYDDVLPYFKKAENNERLSDAYHGQGGPLNVAEQSTPNGIDTAFLEAARQLQMPMTDDFNGTQQEGFGLYQVTQRNGERCSAAKAYLTPNLARANLHVVTHAQATKIVLDGRKAVGIAYRQGRTTKTVTARREVVLCGGTFATPQLLMLSGIGPGEALRTAGVDVVHDLPGVGKNLQDHLDYVTIHRSPDTDLFGLSARGIGKIASAISEWRRKRTGMLTSPFAEGGAFLKTDPGLAVPDIQLHFVVAMVDDHCRRLHWGHGYSCHVCVLRPKSRGTVSLASSDPTAPPRIDPNFLADDADLETLVKGFKIMRRVLQAPAFDAYRGTELYTEQVRSDDDIRAAIRTRADTVYHPAGTCRMGPTSDDLAVLDGHLKVRGIDNLRVADASAMPTLIGGNTNAPTIMIGERAADFIRSA